MHTPPLLACSLSARDAPVQPFYMGAAEAFSKGEGGSRLGAEGEGCGRHKPFKAAVC